MSFACAHAYLCACVSVCSSSIGSLLPKVELFAREIRPFWHAIGNEVLHFQHLGFYVDAVAVNESASDECRSASAPPAQVDLCAHADT